MHFARIHPLPAFIVLYSTMYGGFGVASPFWPQFFAHRGLTPEQVGFLLGLGAFIRLISGPVVGRFADLSGGARVVLAVCTSGAAGLALLMLTVHGFRSILLAHLAQAFTLAPIAALADALAVSAAKRLSAGGPFEYGWVRGAGSAAFVIGTLVAGQVLGVWGLPSIPWMQAALLTAAAIATTLIPGLEVAPERHLRMRSAWYGLRELWAIRLFRRLTIVAGLVFGSHAIHDSFAVIRWSDAGIGPAVTSMLWSEAVAAEILVFFLIGPRLLNRLGPNRAAALAAGAGVVRWIVMAQTTSALVVAIVQPLHGLTFALLHLACMRLIGVVVPNRLAATAQAVYALGAGFATASLTLASGELYARWDGMAFMLMAALCALALPLAWFGLTGNRSSNVKQT